MDWEEDEKQRLMERCIGKCGELSLSYLSSLGIQSLSQHTASTGGKPGAVLELLTRSDVLNRWKEHFAKHLNTSCRSY